jgi:malonate transporter
MLDIIPVTGAIFALIALGYLAVRFKMFSPQDLRVFGKYVLNFALPALIFRAVAGRDLGEILDPGYLGAYLIGSLSVLTVGYWWCRVAARQAAIASAFQAMGMTCANSGFVGYPILLIAMPTVAAKALALNMMVENLILIPAVLVIAERATAGSIGAAMLREIGKRVLLNPIILGLFAGVLVSALGIDLPEVVIGPINMLASSSAAISLMVIGGTLVGLPIKSIDGTVATVVFGKLILLPLAVWVGLLVMDAIGFGVADTQMARAAVIMASTPATGIYPILAQRYGQEDNAALALLVMTALSFFTISALLLL